MKKMLSAGLRISCVSFVFAALFSFAAQAQEVLRVYNWNDYIDLSVLEDFTKESGITVDYQTFSSGNEIRALIESGAAMDMAIVPHFLLRELMEGRYLLKLDNTTISNRRNLDAFIASKVAVLGAGGYALPYLWYSLALGINQKAVAATGFKQDWGLLFDESKNAQLKDCGIALADAPVELYARLLSFGGYPAVLEKTPINRLRRISRKVLLPLQGNLRYIDSDRYLYDLGKGEVCMAMGWSGGIARAMQMNPDVQAIFPQHGAMTLAFDVMVLPKMAKNTQGAQRLMDFLLRPEISARNANHTFYGSPLDSASVKPFRWCNWMLKARRACTC